MSSHDQNISSERITSELNKNKQIFISSINPFLDEGITCTSDLLKIQQSASLYFNSAVALIQRVSLHKLDDNKEYAISLVGDCRAVLETFIIYHDIMIENIKSLGLDAKKFSLSSQDGLSNIQRIIKKYSKKEIYGPIVEDFKSRNLPIDGFTIGTPVNWKRVVTGTIGVIVFITFLTIALVNPNLSDFSKKIITSLYFMGVAIGIAPFVTDNIKVNGKIGLVGSEFKISAIGGLAVLIISFLIQLI